MQAQQRVITGLFAEMEQAGISVLTRDALSESDVTHLADVFLNKVFPVLSPLAIDPAHPFPFIPNTGYCLALELERAREFAAGLELRIAEGVARDA